jgi:hypothetical protein
MFGLFEWLFMFSSSTILTTQGRRLEMQREIVFRYRESRCDTLALFEETPWFFNVPVV